MGNNGSLTMMVIALGAFILIIGLSLNVYIDLMQNNDGSIDTEFLTQYAEIQGYQTQLNEFSKNASDKSIWSSIPTGIASTFNALIIGIGGVMNFFSFITIIPAFFTTVFDSPVFAIPAMVFSFILFAVGIWIATQAYKAIRNSQEAP